MNFHQYINGEKAGMVTASGSVLAAFIAGAACIGPLAGIAMGVGGLAWLSRLSYLTLPASMLSLVLLTAAVYFYKTRKFSCANRRRHRFHQAFLVLSVCTVAGINGFEYLVIPFMA